MKIQALNDNKSGIYVVDANDGMFDLAPGEVAEVGPNAEIWANVPGDGVVVEVESEFFES